MDDDEDISILHHTPGQFSIDDQIDSPTRNFEIRSRGGNFDDQTSVHILRGAFDNLKAKYNDLQSKNTKQAQRIRELETGQLSPYGSDTQTGSFCLVNPDNMEHKSSSDAEVVALKELITELQKKLNERETELRKARIIISDYENEKYNARIEKNPELQARNVILEKQLRELVGVKEENVKLKEENANLRDENRMCFKEVKELTDVQLALKKQMLSNSSLPKETIYKPMTDIVRGSSFSVIMGMKDTLSDFSLNSSLPAAEELAQLKEMIKKLKTVITAQNATLRKISGNPLVMKILNGDKVSLAADSVKGSNSSLNSGSPVRTNGHTGLVRQNGFMNSYDAVLGSSIDPIHEPHVKIEADSPERNLQQFKSKSESEVVRVDKSSVPMINAYRSRSFNDRPAEYSKESERSSPIYDMDKSLSSQIFNKETERGSRMSGYGLMDNSIPITSPENISKKPTYGQFVDIGQKLDRSRRSPVYDVTENSLIRMSPEAERVYKGSVMDTSTPLVFARESERTSPVNNIMDNSLYKRVNRISVSDGNCRQVTPSKYTAREVADSGRVNSLKRCPVCDADFTHRDMTDFQTHVFHCVDSEDQPDTLVSTGDTQRVCPMCNFHFPSTVPQIDVDNHVHSHFGETPADGFEIVH